MNCMNARRCSVPSVLLVFLLLGCRPERIHTKASNPRQLAFAQAGVTLLVGEEWECRNVNFERGPYPPTLVSEAGSIRVMLLPSDRSDPDVVADGLRVAFDHNSRSAKHTFQRQQLASDNGVQGVCVSYRQCARESEGASAVENLHYLVKNRAGRCVVINYVASADGVDTSAIHRMFRTSLSLQ